MTGSEKQVRWAQDIKKKFESFALTLPDEIRSGLVDAVSYSRRRDFADYAQKQIDEILEWDSAKRWINNRGPLETRDRFILWLMMHVEG